MRDLTATRAAGPVLAAVCALAVLAGGAAATAGRTAVVPVRVCADRGEGTAPIRRFSTPTDIVAGRVAFRGLRLYAARATLLRAPLGTGKNRIYFVKAGAMVRTGLPVTISIAPRDRTIASLGFVRGPGSAGLRLGYPVERLEPCAPETKAFAYKGTVGPLTSFPGGFVVKRPACVTITVTSGDAKPIRKVVSLGAGPCRASG